MLAQVLDKVGRLSWTPMLLGKQELMARACRSTGLDDFGGDSFREPLQILLGSLEHEASLSLLGRFLARKNILQLLETRLKLIAQWKRHPEIADRPILQPIVVTGLPRSGTPLLHSLLAQDPALRVPLTWEVMLPIPAYQTWLLQRAQFDYKFHRAFTQPIRRGLARAHFINA